MDREESLKNLSVNIVFKATTVQRENHVEVVAFETDIANMILNWCEKDYYKDEILILKADIGDLEDDKERAEEKISETKNLIKKLITLYNLD